jgi:predicted GNAT family N-acyltransferase
MNKLAVSIITSSSEEYAAVFALRDEVLRKPLGMSLKNDDLSRDHIDVIFAGKMNGEVVACLMLHHVDAATVQLRQMAVYDAWQGKGVGRELVIAAEKFAAEKGYTCMILHARKVAVGFYASMNYETVGDEFLEVGIPHYIMQKTLK